MCERHTKKEWAIVWGIIASGHFAHCKKKKTGKYKFRTVIVGPLCMIMTYTYFICICCFADLAATRHALGVSCVPNGTFWAHEQCKAEPKGLCQPQVLLCSGGGSSDDISIFLHASSLQHNTFLAKQNEIRINLGNGGSGKKTLISSDCLVWIRFFFFVLLRKTEWKITFSFRLSPMLPDAIGHLQINGLKRANEFKIRYALLANMQETVSNTRCNAATN